MGCSIKFVVVGVVVPHYYKRRHHNNSCSQQNGDIYVKTDMMEEMMVAVALDILALFGTLLTNTIC